MSDDVSITMDHDAVSASTVVDATPDEVFDFLRRPANHVVISGDGSVRGVSGDAGGDQPLQLGDRFGMKMKIGVPYRMRSKVVELEPDHVIGWSHIGGHRWRWTLDAGGRRSDAGHRDVRHVDGEVPAGPARRRVPRSSPRQRQRLGHQARRPLRHGC